MSSHFSSTIDLNLKHILSTALRTAYYRHLVFQWLSIISCQQSYWVVDQNICNWCSVLVVLDLLPYQVLELFSHLNRKA